MWMYVVHVRDMRMRVPQPGMLMEMSVGISRRIRGAMRVLMMLIMRVRMGVSHRLMNVLMLMAFGQMKPNPNRHEYTGNGELCSDGFTERDDRGDAAEKG